MSGVTTKRAVRALKVALWIGGLAPTAWMAAGAYYGWLGANPIEKLEHVSGMAALISLLAPLLVSLIPIFLAARTTVREAISTYGLSTDAGLIERILAKVRYISRLMIITISNTFRHKWRAILMQIALVVSGLAYMMVASIQSSVDYTIRDVLFGILNVDVTMVFEEPQRIDYLTELTMDYPGIQRAEMWGLTGATLKSVP